MQLAPEHIAHIRQEFATMSTKDEFVALLNYAKELLIGAQYKPFELKQITYYANPKVSGRRYRKFEIKKKSGGVRVIHSPVKGLSLIQRCLNLILQCVFTPHDAAKGFVQGKSIVDNAKMHVGRNYVYNIDLKDFFPSIDQARVWKCLQLAPFNLKDTQAKYDSFDELSAASRTIFILMWQKMNPKPEEFPADWFGYLIAFSKAKTNSDKVDELSKLRQIFAGIIREQKYQEQKTILQKILRNWWDNITGGRLQIANIMSSLCCNEMYVERIVDGHWQQVKKNVLPQGAATSPLITNVICQRLDYLLTGVAKRFGLRYTRYVDDITFSSQHNIFKEDGEFIKELRRIIAEQGFHIKESKVRLQQAAFRQEVTGLIVNKTVNVNQNYIKQVRMWLYNWERYGYDRAYNYFLPSYFASKTTPVKGKPDMANVIDGKLNYLKMVKGGESEMYLKLKDRFDILCNVTSGIILKTTINPSVNALTLATTTNTIGLTSNKTNGKLKININSTDLTDGEIKLKRRIIIDKGETLPLEKYELNEEKEQKEIDLSKHKPTDVTRFLLNFRASEGLKFLTHDYDRPGSVFNYHDIMQVANKEFQELTSLYLVPQSLKTRIYQFAFGDPNNAWWFNKMPYKLNWKSPELLHWMQNNPNIHPIKNENFEKGFITPFKKSIEIKAPELEYIFKNKLAESLASKYLSFDIELINLDKANFYTNVDAFQAGISYIIKAIKQRFNNSTKIKIEFSRKTDAEGRKRIIKITHINSVCDKPLEKNELFQGDLLEAEKALFGICDWSIISRSPDKSVNKLNILFDINSNISPREKIDDALIEGFTHVITFYS